MNRFLFVAVVGLMAVGATGCATGIEDPQPGPAPVTQSRPAPATPFNAELSDDGRVDPNVLDDGIEAPPLDREFGVPEPVEDEPIDPNLVDPDPNKGIKIEHEIPVNG